MTSTKIHSTHCERTACVYVRQSTWLQVSENRESTERQYNLRERAIELGWPASHVEVIDEDQGRSGSTATFRTGFQRLAAEVGLGKVGIVLMLEASRLARNNSCNESRSSPASFSRYSPVRSSHSCLRVSAAMARGAGKGRDRILRCIGGTRYPARNP
jgi:hypothetical protein